MSEPTPDPADPAGVMEVIDWGQVHEPTQDRTTEEVESDEPHPDH